MSLQLALTRMYPQADPMSDFTVIDRGDGRGSVIERWNEEKLGAVPTHEQILTALAAEQSDREAFAGAVALLKANYATMTPMQKALCVVLKRVVQEMRD